MDDAVRFELLGPLRARRGSAEIDLGPARQQAVLAALLLAANDPLPATEIVDQVWGSDPPENGANVVQKYVAGLRRVLEPERTPRAAAQTLTLTPTGYRLTVSPGGSDLGEFTSRVQQVQALRALGRCVEAAAEVRSALALWRAEPLAGLPGGYFDAVRAQLAESRADALQEWAELELEQGHEATLLPELTRLIAEYPDRQRLRAAQVVALYRTGRQAEAHMSYQEALQLSGGRPGPELQGAYAQLLHKAQPPAERVVDEVRPFGQPPPVWQPLRLQDRLLKVAAVLVPPVTGGLGCGPMMAVLAVRRRSWRLALAAVGYLVLSFAGPIVIGESETDEFRPIDGVMVTLWVLTMLVCSLHAAWLVPARQSPRPVQVLVDLNSAPLAVLRTLPGVPPEHAALIIAERNHRGPFRSLEDVAARGVFSWPLPRPIADVVLVVPVEDAPKEERR
ncbi:hypothetical protein HPO96_36340 [Kribbella sandramycini]|uniref:DNA-binding SARP family transcriptional activator n=1 Tax=Kribbella sandramycini TaxID=60450 RepID=A0A7Y4L7C4_9ACTN|nr:DNA-binding SARP family transcriptional activator [Kribbella sandramycini]NOL45728.1 hypothetical protein [Kribbella sandramycini]